MVERGARWVDTGTMRSLGLVLCLVATIGCGSVENQQPADAPVQQPDAPVTLSSIAIEPDTVSVRVGAVVDLVARATFSDNSTRDVTGMANWSMTQLGGAATVVAGRVTGVTPGQVQITAELDGRSGNAVVTVLPEAKLMVSSFNTPSVKVFAITAMGDVAAQRTIAGASTGQGNPRGLFVSSDEIFLADQGASALNVYPINADGNAAPVRRIVGAATQLSQPVGVLVHQNEVYVSNQSGVVTVFPINGTGNIAPTRTITGLANAHHMAIFNNELYVTEFAGAAVKVFPINASGAAVPTRTIAGAATRLTSPTGLLVSNNELFVVSTSPGGIHAFALDANGDVAPIRSITGPATLLNFPDQLAIFNGEIYISSFSNNSLHVFPVTGTGDIAPTRTITGAASGLAGPLGAFIF